MSKTFIEPKIYLVEDFPCERKEQLTGRERHYIENTDCVNKVVPGRNKKEYYKFNKKKIVQKSKQYYQDNKEKKCEKEKEKYVKNKCEILKIRTEWYIKNKDILSEKRKEKYTCDCGSTIRKSDKCKHIKSKKHLKFIANNINDGYESD